MRRVTSGVLGVLTLGALGCGPEGEEGGTASPTPTESPSPTVVPGAVDYEIQFRAVIGGQGYACGQRYDGQGTEGDTLEPMGLRIFVSEVELVNFEGAGMPLQLEQDGVWQYQNVALLDFEDGSGECDAGNADLNTSVRGSVSGLGTPAGLRFTVGVPAELNHLDAATQPSPLNVPDMFWGWTSGYIFLRFDAATEGFPNGMSVHVGSTTCVLNEAGTASCEHPNLMPVELGDFNPAVHVVTVDIGALLAGLDLGFNTEGTAPLCMSQPTDPECSTVFDALGLPFGEDVGGAQRVFGME